MCLLGICREGHTCPSSPGSWGQVAEPPQKAVGWWSARPCKLDKNDLSITSPLFFLLSGAFQKLPWAWSKELKWSKWQIINNWPVWHFKHLLVSKSKSDAIPWTVGHAVGLVTILCLAQVGDQGPSQEKRAGLTLQEASSEHLLGKGGLYISSLGSWVVAFSGFTRSHRSLYTGCLVEVHTYLCCHERCSIVTSQTHNLRLLNN